MELFQNPKVLIAPPRTHIPQKWRTKIVYRFQEAQRSDKTGRKAHA